MIVSTCSYIHCFNFRRFFQRQISINLHKIQPALTESVAVFIANSVSGFLVAALLSAFNLFQLQIVGNGRHPLSFAAHSARESRIVHFALLAVPCGRAHAVEFSNFILNIIRTIQIRNRKLISTEFQYSPCRFRRCGTDWRRTRRKRPVRTWNQ